MKKELITLWPTFLKEKKKKILQAQCNYSTIKKKKIFSLTFSTSAL